MNCTLAVYIKQSVSAHMFKSLYLSVCFYQEWLDVRCRGVRSANAYILVYDICCVESFEYVKMIRQQIVDNR